MTLTIIEAVRLNPGNVVRSAIVEMYARNSDILRVIPFENIAGNALKYDREDNLFGIGFCGIQDDFSESDSVLNPITESLIIAGGDLDVDRLITQTLGVNQRSVPEGLKVKALAYRWTLAFIKGDSSADPREFEETQKVLLSVVNGGVETLGTTSSFWRKPFSGSATPFYLARPSKETLFLHSTSRPSALMRMQR